MENIIESAPASLYYFDDGRINYELYYLNDVWYLDKGITDNWEAFCRMQIFR